MPAPTDRLTPVRSPGSANPRPAGRPAVRPVDHAPGRALVVDSWMRSAAAGVDAEDGFAPVSADIDDIPDQRSAHPLSRVFPLLYDVLGAAAEDCDAVMALGDAEGKLLWVCGRPSVLRRAEQIHFMEGAVWAEREAGTNAPGTALRLDAAVQIRAGEHYARRVQDWSCAAAPIHDPETQALLGVVDVTGGHAVGSPQTLAMVRAAARMAEAELGRIAAVGRGRTTAAGLWAPLNAVGLRVEALGRPDCQVDSGTRTTRLSSRHSEILVVLAERPDGVSGDELAVQAYAEDVSLSTVRAEMTRLRSLLGADVLQSRPYRLQVPVEADWLEVTARLAVGDVRSALRAYRGPLLPRSEAPAVVDRRDQIQQQLRSAVLASDDADLMVAWTRARWGADDVEMWRRQARILPPSSPLRPLAIGEARRLDQLFG